MNIIKFPLAILLFVCLLDMPYGYFQIVRYLALIGFSILAFNSYKEGKDTVALIYLCLAILFQPLFKFPLGRQVWSIIYAASGIGLLLSLDNLKGLIKK